MNLAHGVALVVALCFSLPACAAGAAQPSPPRKKLIEYGWDVPAPAFVRAHIREMEQRPFDGLILRLPNLGNVFTVAKWDEAQYAAALDDLRNIRWRKFTDNFIIMWSASTMDWFSDKDWETVRRNVGLVAQAAAAGRCRGVCFDAEPYGGNPWAYSEAKHRAEKSFAQYEVQVRKRGAEFMRAITEHMPHAVVHTFFLLSLFPHIAAEPDPARRAQALAREGYALLPAFVNGMLDAAPSGAIITDGNESSYYYTDPCSYYRAYHQIRQGALALVAPENVRKYQTQMQVSQALYVDQVFNLRPGVGFLSAALSPQERARWFEQDVYYALATTDEFVWCYSERMNWWENRDIPPGLPEAIQSARRKIAARESLGFNVSEELKAAEKKLAAELESKIVRRTAHIAPRPPATAAPVIDGKLDDPIWQRLAPLDPFLPYLTSASAAPAAQTRLRVTYDESNLYLALQCDEPTPAAIRALGARRDDSGVWSGDSVDIFLSVGSEPEPFLHFILNPRNVQWDAYCRTQDDEDLGFDPDWQSATAIGDSSWNAELALPWKEIGVPAPPPGARHRANVCRRRIPGDEYSTWSQVLRGFVAPQYFGTWVFGEQQSSLAVERSPLMDNSLSRGVQMQFMQPRQVEEAARRFPVAYVPFGLIEWHGPHLPLGNDALKAHAILVKCAEQFGGVVYPPVYFHEGFDQAHLVPVLTQLFERLKSMGFRVIIGISGHNVRGQIDMINRALEPVLADHTVAGIGCWEVSLSAGEESNTDHAAKWETSNMMFFHPDLVDLKALGEEEMTPELSRELGIAGLDPRIYASAEVGRRNCELAAQAIGRKAQELLDSLPPEQRTFRLPALAPKHWWSI
jgi:creatinine amidohydrolase/Fe(II)-dependent formamide hydrolase-like protein